MFLKFSLEGRRAARRLPLSGRPVKLDLKISLTDCDELANKFHRKASRPANPLPISLQSAIYCRIMALAAVALVFLNHIAKTSMRPLATWLQSPPRAMLRGTG